MGHILIVRTEPGATEVSQALVKLGHEAQPCPLLAIAPVALTAPQRQQVDAWSDFDDVIVVSGHAGRCFVQQHLHLADKRVEAGVAGDSKGAKNSKRLKSAQAVRFFAVGPASAAPLQAAGLHCRKPQLDFRTEGLLKLPDLQQLAGRRILILRGRGGRRRAYLGEALASRGAKVQQIDLYERKPNAAALAKLPEQLQITWDAVLVGSGNLLVAMADALGDTRMPWPLLVPSARVLAMAQTLGFPAVINLQALDPQSLDRWLKQTV